MEPVWNHARLSECSILLTFEKLMYQRGAGSGSRERAPSVPSLTKPADQPSGLFLCRAWQAVGASFQANVFRCGRYNPRIKSSGPALLEPSLKVKRNNAHGQSSAFKVAAVLGHLNEHARLKGARARRNECHRRDLVGTTGKPFPHGDPMKRRPQLAPRAGAISLTLAERNYIHC
jgi:hypothetical protein